MKQKKWLKQLPVIIFVVIFSLFAIRTAPPRVHVTLPEAAMMHLALPAEHLFQALAGHDHSRFFQNPSVVEGDSLQEGVRQLTKQAMSGEKEDHLSAVQAATTPSQYRLTYVLGVSYSQSGGVSEMKINKGEKHGITAGMAVVSASGLVGQVTTTSEYTGYVMLLDDSYSRIQVKTMNSDEPIGEVTGDPFKKEITLKNIVGNEPAIGEMLVTTANDAIPGGLHVGRVSSWRNHANQTREAILEPAFNQRHEHTYFVVTEMQHNTSYAPREE